MPGVILKPAFPYLLPDAWLLEAALMMSVAERESGCEPQAPGNHLPLVAGRHH